VQVGFVVLVGLACKNAILSVEFARDRQLEGASRFDAAVEAAKVRLRPIIMTSFAFVLGVFPLVIAQGAGAEMRRTLGTAVFAGMSGGDPVRPLPDPRLLLRHPPVQPGTLGPTSAGARAGTAPVTLARPSVPVLPGREVAGCESQRWSRPQTGKPLPAGQPSGAPWLVSSARSLTGARPALPACWCSRGCCAGVRRSPNTFTTDSRSAPTT